jgi:hypothetical protein
MSLHSYPTNSHHKFKQKGSNNSYTFSTLIHTQIHHDLECNYMIPCKNRFLCIGFPKHLVGVTSLLQYKTFIRMQLLNNNNNNDNKESGSLMKY